MVEPRGWDWFEEKELMKQSLSEEITFRPPCEAQTFVSCLVMLEEPRCFLLGGRKTRPDMTITKKKTFANAPVKPAINNEIDSEAD